MANVRTGTFFKKPAPHPMIQRIQESGYYFRATETLEALQQIAHCFDAQQQIDPSLFPRINCISPRRLGFAPIDILRSIDTENEFRLRFDPYLQFTFIVKEKDGEILLPTQEDAKVYDVFIQKHPEIAEALQFKQVERPPEQKQTVAEPVRSSL